LTWINARFSARSIVPIMADSKGQQDVDPRLGYRARRRQTSMRAEAH
jgi:hypothetical protein